MKTIKSVIKDSKDNDVVERDMKTLQDLFSGMTIDFGKDGKPVITKNGKTYK